MSFFLNPYRYAIPTLSTPTYVGAGAGDSALLTDPTPELTPSYPTGLAPGDLLVLHVAVRRQSSGGGASVTVPSGWTAQYTEDTGVANPGSSEPHHVIMTKNARAIGTETGTISVTWTHNGVTSLVCAVARIYAFRGVAEASFIEAAGFAGQPSVTTTIGMPTTGTATGTNRFAVCFQALDKNLLTPVSPTGETGGNWSYAEKYETAVGSTMTIVMQTAPMNSGGSISGGSWTAAQTTAYLGRAFMLVPYDGGPVPDPPLVYDQAKTPEDFGATGNGVADDTNPLQALIAWAGAGTSGDIRLMRFGTGNPAKSYTHSGQLFLSGKGYFAIEGNGATLVRRGNFIPISGTDSAPQIRLLDCHHFDLRNLIVDGSRGKTSFLGGDVPSTGDKMEGIRLSSCYNYSMYDMTFKDMGWDGIHFRTTNDPDDTPDNFGRDGLLVRCACTNCGRTGAGVEYQRRITFNYCTFSGTNGENTQCGVDCEPFAPGTGNAVYGNEDITFNDCTFADNNAAGVQTTVVVAANPQNRRFTFRRCTFLNNGINDAGQFSGMLGHLVLRYVNTVTVDGCHFLGGTALSTGAAKKSCIIIGPSGTTGLSYPTNVVIKNNDFSGNTGCSTAIRWRRAVAGASGGAGCIITNNVIDFSAGFDARTTSPITGLEPTSPCAIDIMIQNVTVTNNTSITGQTSGFTGVIIEDWTGNLLPNNAIVTGNTFNDCDVGIDVRDGTGHDTSGNTFNNTSPTII